MTGHGVGVETKYEKEDFAISRSMGGPLGIVGASVALRCEAWLTRVKSVLPNGKEETIKSRGRRNSFCSKDAGENRRARDTGIG